MSEERQREYARIDVQLWAKVDLLTPAKANELTERIMKRPSVWAPREESALREITLTGSGVEAILAGSLLEVSEQIVHIRTALQAQGPSSPATLLQLSGGGGLLSTELMPELDSEIDLQLDAPEQGAPPIRCIARIVHRDPPDVYGFAFAAIHPRDQERLIRYLYTLQRRSIREHRREG
ncbi:hypothetical protein ABI59_14420 [Acidobacteria bacterium Mor1]|nr:hypothetical protein ABI59_14420 [Acidobacteria bacterium Mor1]